MHSLMLMLAWLQVEWHHRVRKLEEQRFFCDWQMELIEKNIIIIQWGVVIGASLGALVLDLRSRRIPNILCGPLFAAGLIWAIWNGGINGFGNSIAAAFVLAFPFVLLFLFAGGGAGDAKLMAAIGTWVGLQQGITVLACVCIAGGILAVVTAIVKKRLRGVVINIVLYIYIFIIGLSGKRGIRSAADLARPEQMDRLTVPYGVAIFAGVCAAAGWEVIWK